MVRGGNAGKNDGGYLTEFSQGPLRIGDELIYYYGCSSYGKNHAQNVHRRRWSVRCKRCGRMGSSRWMREP
jgi:hypothetical protein